MSHRKLFYAIIFLGIILALTGCVSLNDPEASQEYHSEVIATVDDGQTFGQSFVSRRADLDGIYLWLAVMPGAAQDGGLVAELYHSSGENKLLNTQQIPLSEVAKGNPFHFSLTTQQDPSAQEYYLVLKPQGGGIQVFGRNEDVYPQGQANTHGFILPGDASFRLTYRYGSTAFLEDLGSLRSGLWMILPLIVVLLLPGWLILEFSGIDFEIDSGEGTGLALGLSLSILPVAMLWTTQIRLRWTAGALLITAALLCLLAAWRIGAHLARWSRTGFPKPDPINLALFALFLFSLAVRLIMVRDLAAPAWVDSVHHAIIARLIEENGSFPSSYAPYLQVGTASYHPGFHTLLFAFRALSRLDLPLALLVLGQVLNAMVVYAVYLLTVNLVRHEVSAPRLAGLFAAAIAALFTPMPAYYTSWGRYTQLAGLLILPTAAVLLLWLFEKGNYQVLEGTDGWVERRKIIKILLLTGLACGGLFLTHYRVMAFLVALLAAVWMGSGFSHFLSFASEPLINRIRSIRVINRITGINIPAVKFFTLLTLRQTSPMVFASGDAGLSNPPEVSLPPGSLEGFVPPREHADRLNPGHPGNLWRTLFLGAAWIILAGFLTFLLTLPWWPDLFRSLILPSASSGNWETPALFAGFTWTYLVAGLGRYTLYLAGLGLVIGLLLRRTYALILALWVTLLFLLANLAALRLPGGGLINSISIEITLFIPIAVLGGALLAQLLPRILVILPRRWRSISFAAAGITALLLALLGARSLVKILNPVTLLFREADQPAMQWIQSNLPRDTTILINPFSWGYGLYAGNDGGYWITPLTGRKTVPPPVLYGFDSQATNIWKTNQIIQEVMQRSSDAAGLHAILKEAGIPFVFIGRRGGILSPQMLRESGFFTPLYAQEGVWIFAVNQ